MGKKREEKTDENSGHYVIASSRPLERRTLAPILCGILERLVMVRTGVWWHPIN